MKFKKLIIILLDILGINALFRALNAHQAIILWYHGICDDDFMMLKGYDERHIPKALFRKQLSYLKRKGYQFATMSELARALMEKRAVKRMVVLTFDDGFRNVVENAYPIMKELNARGCFYVVSNLISEQNLLWTDLVETIVRNQKPGKFHFVFQGKLLEYPLDSKESYENTVLDIKKRLRTIPDTARKEHLAQFSGAEPVLKNAPKEFHAASWEQIQSLDKDILEVGSHTKNHPNCANLNTGEEFESELKGSKEDIEHRVGYPISHFCYPAGSYDNRVIDHVRKYGYTSATTIVPGFNDADTPLYELRRIPTDENFWLFKAMVSGSFFSISRLLKRLKGN